MYITLTYFIAVLPAAVIAYVVTPQRWRWITLLAISYACVYHTSRWLALFPLAATIASWVCANTLARLRAEQKAALKVKGARRREVKAAFRGRMRVTLAAGIVFDLALLFVCKYLGTVLDGLGLVAAEGEAATPLERLAHIGMPAGISFYTLMAVSYLVDVYRGTIEAEHNPARLALYVAFFPQMLEGPIARHGQVADDLTAGRVSRKALYLGSLRILWGLAKKIVVADRLNGFVSYVNGNYSSLSGGYIALAAIGYTFQLYCDFSGAIDIALGSAQLFGVSLPENFRQPFLSRTASEFWERWHITLGAFFRDYVYYPVSLSTPMKHLTTAARKRFGLRYGPLLAGSVALLAVWVCNGIWHGSGTQYLFFGLYYFVVITLGGLVEPLAADLAERHHVNRDGIPYQALQRTRTLVVVFLGETIFRANGLQAGLQMIGAIFTRFSLDFLSTFDPSTMRIDGKDIALAAVAAVVLLAFDLYKERGHDVGAEIAQASPAMRWGIWVALALLLVTFGAFGVGYDPVDPLYANF